MSKLFLYICEGINSVKGLFIMAETSGSCGIAPYRKNPGIYHQELKFFDKIKKDYELQQAAKVEREYERIMQIPPQERTFSEKMLVAQVNAAKAADFLNSVLEPSIKYMA